MYVLQCFIRHGLLTCFRMDTNSLSFSKSFGCDRGHIFKMMVLVLVSCVGLSAAAVDVCSQTYSATGPLCSCTPQAYDCSFRSLTQIPESEHLTNHSATILNFRGNRITQVFRRGFNNLREVAIMDLGNNSISDIEDGAFDGLVSLHTLSLSGNRLQVIGSGMFRHLPSLTSINLSNNPIHTIHRHAFLTLPSLDVLNLQSVLLECDCEARLLREFIDLTYSQVAALRLKVFGALCQNLNQVNLLDVPLANFPTCPQGETVFPSTLNCHSCSRANSSKECERISKPKPCLNKVCYSLIQSNSGQISVSANCIDYATCRTTEQRNTNNCKQSSFAPVSCYFCFAGSLTSVPDHTGTMRDFRLRVLITLDKAMTPELMDTSSMDYFYFTHNMETNVQNHLANQNGSFRVQFLGLRLPNVTVHLIINASTMWFVSKADAITAIERKLNSVGTLEAQAILTINTTVIYGGECRAETLYVSGRGTFVWPETGSEVTATLTCPNQLSTGATRKATRRCSMKLDGTVSWSGPVINDCPYADDTSQRLQSIADTDINDGNVVNISSDLKEISRDWERFESDHVAWSVDAISGIVATSLSGTSRDVIGNTVESVDNLLNIQQAVLSQSQNESSSANKLLTGVETLASGIDVTTSDYAAVENNVALVVTKIQPTSFSGLQMTYTGSNENLDNTDLTYRSSDATVADGQSGIVLPGSLLDSLPSGPSVNKVSFTVYKEPKLFEAISPPKRKQVVQIETTGDGSDVTYVTRKVNSNVISATVPGYEVRDLSRPVLIVFQHKQAGENATCVYWDSTANGWSSAGCATNTSQQHATHCTCNHLTNFALLMDVYDTGADLSEAASLSLTIISYVGCAISLIGVTLTLVTYAKFRKLRRDNPSKILMNLCAAIACIDVIFLVGMQTYTARSLGACKAVAAILHYFLLTAFFWMAVEAFYMYLALVKIFDTYISRFQLKSALFGWGLPLIIVILTLSINKTENYGLQAADLCWLERVPFFAAFLAPVCLVLMANTVSYILVIKRLTSRGSKQITSTSRSSTSVRLRGAISLLVLLGLTWLFAFFAIGDVAVVFHYLFALFNTLQGLFIFIFYCCLKKEAQQCWRQCLPCCKGPYEAPDSRQTDTKEREPLNQDPGQDSSTFDASKTTKSDASKDSQTNVEKPKPKYEVDTSSAGAFRGRWQFQMNDDRRPTSSSFT